MRSHREGRRAAGQGVRVSRQGRLAAELVAAIRTVARGDALLFPAATRSLVARFLAHPDHRSPPDPQQLVLLTEREREVQILIAGLSDDEIAGHLVVSPATAKTHVNRAMTKLGARDRAQLVVAAYESGWFKPSRP